MEKVCSTLFLFYSPSPIFFQFFSQGGKIFFTTLYFVIFYLPHIFNSLPPLAGDPIQNQRSCNQSLVITCRGTLLDPVTNWRNLALSVWSNPRRARQNLHKISINHFFQESTNKELQNIHVQTRESPPPIYLKISVRGYFSPCRATQCSI